MRWFVEISSLGANEGPKQKWCLEAAGWQPALKDARALRGEEGPLGGFSIELLDDGARAVDPVARIRYVIREAPAGAPLTHTKTGPVAAEPAKPEPAKEAARPEPPKAAPAKEPPKTEPPKAAPAKEAPRPEPPKEAPKPEPPKAAPAAAPAGDDVDVDIPVDTDDAAPKAAAAPALPAFELLRSREEDPSEASPLTYREHVYVVDPSVSDADVERLMHARLQAVQQGLAGAKPGRFVNLAVFDHRFTGKPQRPPRATLAWKDWRGAPDVRFPASGGASAAPPSFAAPTSASQPVPQPSVPPQRMASQPPAGASSPPPTEPVPTPLASTQPAPVLAPAPAPPDAPRSGSAAPARLSTPSAAGPVSVAEALRPTEPSPAPVAAKQPVPAAPKTKPAATHAPAPAPAPAPPREAYIPAVKTAAQAGPRVAGDELIGELFEACGDLQFARDSLEGADFVLGLALEKLPSELGLVSLFDINRREFVVVRQAGGSRSVVLARLPERAGLALAAMRKRAAVVVPDAASDARALDDRFRTLGIELKSMIVAPVEQSGRYLGLIELVNPIDGRPFTEGDGHALTYIGEQYAEFVAARGVLLDPQQVIERHQKR